MLLRDIDVIAFGLVRGRPVLSELKTPRIRSIPTILKFKQVRNSKIVEITGKGIRVLNLVPDVTALLEVMNGNCCAEEAGDKDMRDLLRTVS